MSKFLEKFIQRENFTWNRNSLEHNRLTVEKLLQEFYNLHFREEFGELPRNHFVIGEHLNDGETLGVSYTESSNEHEEIDVSLNSSLLQKGSTMQILDVILHEFTHSFLELYGLPACDGDEFFEDTLVKTEVSCTGSYYMSLPISWKDRLLWYKVMLLEREPSNFFHLFPIRKFAEDAGIIIEATYIVVAIK